MDEATRADARRRLIWNGVRWTLALLIVAALFRLIRPAEIGQALIGIPLVPFLAVLGAYLVTSFFGDTAYWWLYLRLFRIERPYDELLAVRGYTYLLMVLHYGFSVGGIGVYLHKRAGVPAVRSGALMLVFMIGETLCLAGLALAGLRLMGEGRFAPLEWICLAVIGGILALLAGMRIRPVAGLAARLRVPDLFLETPLHVWLSAAALRVPYQLLMVAYHALALPLFGIDAPLAAVIAFVPVLMFVIGLPLTPAGLGTSQAAMLYLFGDYGPAENLLALSFLTALLITVGRVPIGLWYAWRRPAILG